MYPHMYVQSCVYTGVYMTIHTLRLQSMCIADIQTTDKLSF